MKGVYYSDATLFSSLFKIKGIVGLLCIINPEQRYDFSLLVPVYYVY